jgi:hypothetical protein
MRAHRVAISISAAALAAGGLAGVACSSSSPRGFVDDAGSDVTTIDSAVPVDAFVADQGTETAPPFDAGPKVEGGCSPINTACDIVTQNCPAGKECQSASGSNGTQCVDIAPSRHLPRGHACCSSDTAGQDQCAPGLHCIGPSTPCTSDAGLAGRCSPACCANDVCGISDPEGFPGRCDLSIVDNAGKEQFKVCDYDPPCKPFHVQACPANFTCIIEDQFGTSSCVGIYAPIGDGGTLPNGYTEGAACDSANGCGDGMLCLGPPDGGSTCSWLCLTPNSNPPFDAGALRDAGPGYGGCPVGERCVGSITGPIPLWVSFCTP